MKYSTRLIFYYVLIVSFLLHLYFPFFLDSKVNWIWERISESRAGKYQFLEPLVASYWFGGCVIFFDIVIEGIPYFRNNFKYYQKEVRCTSLQSYFSTFVYMFGVWFLQKISEKFYYTPKGSDREVTFMFLFLEVLFGIVLYDFLFYWLHLAMHKVPFLRRFHKQHHESKEMSARETVNHSFIDGSLQVLTNIFVQNITPFGAWGTKHKFSRLLHNISVIYLLCESHSGYDLPFASHNLFPYVFGGSKEHEKHHRYYETRYQQFFTYFSYFEKKSYPEIKAEKKKKSEWSLSYKIVDYFSVYVVNQILVWALLHVNDYYLY